MRIKESKVAENIVFVEPERSEAERSGAERSAGPTKTPIHSARNIIPDPEVSAKSRSRSFAASYQPVIVRKAEACREPGEIGALLRREGLYASQLAQWRKLYRDGAEAALKDDKRGRKATINPLAHENAQLRRELEHTQKKLKQAETIIEFQKNLSEMLGISPTSVSREGEN